MPVETSTLYGEMAGSWVLHLTIPLIAGLMLNAVPVGAPRIPIFIGIIVVMSFALQTGLIAFLQQSACNGVKNYGRILAAGGLAAFIAAIMVAIPVYVEPMRLVVSQLFLTHTPMTDTPVTGPSVEDQQRQREWEISLGASYWAAFAGAYGIGIGSIIASRCN